MAISISRAVAATKLPHGIKLDQRYDVAPHAAAVRVVASAGLHGPETFEHVASIETKGTEPRAKQEHFPSILA